MKYKDEELLQQSLREWIKYTLTASVGTVLISRQIMLIEHSDFFMKELSKFRNDLVGQVDEMEVKEMLDLLFEDTLTNTTFKRPDWLDESGYETFVYIARKHLDLIGDVAKKSLETVESMVTRGKK